MEAAHSNIRGDIPSFATQKSPLTPESCSHGMRSQCAFLTREKQQLCHYYAKNRIFYIFHLCGVLSMAAGCVAGLAPGLLWEIGYFTYEMIHTKEETAMDGGFRH